MSKVAIVVLADPSTESEESLGRIFNALVLAKDLQDRGVDFKMFFQGTGTRWIEYLSKEDHPAYGLFVAIKSNIAGVSKACSQVFKANCDNTITQLDEFQIPGLGGATSLASYLDKGYQLVSF